MSAPASAQEMADALAEASAARRTVHIVGGGTRSRQGVPTPAASTIATSGIARLVDHEPADLTATVEAGMAVADLAAALARAGQSWPQAHVRPGSTVGGVLAAAASGRSRLREGPVRDGVLELVFATGDGRVVKAGGRTVKGVAGYDLCRLMVGSMGALGAICQVTLKLWPVPTASGWFALEAGVEERIEAGRRVLASAHRPASVLLAPGRLAVRLVGVPEDVAPPAGFAVAAEPADLEGAGLLRVGVPPARTGELARRLEAMGLSYEAQMGVGAATVAVDDREQLTAVREAAVALGGHAVVEDGPEELRVDPWGAVPPGAHLVRRLKAAFDPAGILAPGRLAGAA